LNKRKNGLHSTISFHFLTASADDSDAALAGKLSESWSNAECALGESIELEHAWWTEERAKGVRMAVEKGEEGERGKSRNSTSHRK
jgi:hypothetical protein